MDKNYGYGIKRTGADGADSGRHRRRKVRLWVCVGIFACAVAVKAAAPETADEVSAGVMRVIDGSVDYRAAFAAVGSFVSGDISLGEAAAVLKGGVEESEPAATELPPISGAGQSNLQTMYLQCLEAGLKRQAEQAAPAMAEVRSGGDGLPDNVCAEAEKLPFEYTRPVPGECSSAFGYREHPIDGEGKFHYGMDFRGDEGDDIFAFAQGHVAASGISETAGKYLIISHGDGWTTQYFHCSEVYATGGSPVERGQIVAAVGQTGAATGPHLHFELICDGVYHDPGAYLDEQG